MKRKLLLLLFTFSAYTGFSQNNYLDFDGVNDNVTVAGSGNLLSSSETISMSCKVFPKNDSPSFPAFNGFAGYRNDSNFDFYLIQLTSTEVEARFRNSSGVGYTLTYDGLVLEEWNHFFLVYDGSYLTLYLGDQEVASVAASGSVPASNSSTFKIGNIQYSSFNFYHQGYIDEVSLWSKALTGTDISTIMYNNGEIAAPEGETDLKLYYKFNQGTAYGSNAGLTTLTNEMGTLNGTLNNFALTGTTSNWGSEEELATNNFMTSKVSIYPNPTSSQIHFSGFSEINTIKIVDLAGRVILTQEEIKSQTATVNVADLTSGVYFAIINQSETIKFIKQ
ncbi:LamG-like jellyroll fold domain-containing protein [Flavobacterium soli]|uniref:LamG-like jellyroll fold domain-containing protein n=1 Tax=Flavobacterium soli TaxID=344881 RepID=UPI0003FF029A|nr:LamG-like jellyroll fold domain-containing protein [Flavobacterium soli]